MERQEANGLHLKMGPSAGAHVDAYLEYRRIVGDDDGGVPFTEEQYEKYKKDVVQKRMENRLYVSWTSPSGMDCKLIGPETPCFCGHRYKGHKTDFDKLPSKRPIFLPCRTKGCRCETFQYVPMIGSNPVRCSCKHAVDEHNEALPCLCKKTGCRCAGFRTGYTCECGLPAHQHNMVVETKEERLAQGKPVGRDVPYQAMGGITGFSSLAAGYQRMDPSGIGAPPPEILDSPITASDHPFLRSNVRSIHEYRKLALEEANAGNKGKQLVDPMIDKDLAEMMSQMRQPGESELDYYERRYQEREKQSKVYRGPPKRITKASSSNQKPPLQ